MRNPDCTGCSACCRGQMIMLMPGDVAALYQTIKATNPLTGREGQAIPQTTDGACIYLDADCCSIYERRPAICRAFNCIDFAERMIAGTTRAQRRRDRDFFENPVMQAGLRQATP